MNRNDYEKKYDRLRTLEAVRRRIVDRFNKKRKADNYEHDADTIAEYTDVIAPLYWQIREEWTGMPADFEDYYKRRKAAERGTDMQKRNKEIRDAMKAAGLTQFLLGELIGKSDSAVYRMLRKELPDAEKAELMQIIQKAGEENANV